LDVTAPVLVFKIGRYVLHHGALGIIRSLGRLKVPVYAVVEDGFSPVALSRYLSGAFVWRNQGLSTDALLAGIAAIGKQFAQSPIIIPTDDSAAAFIAENAEILGKSFLFPRLPPDLPRRLSNKQNLYRLCRSIGVPCPETASPRCLADVHAFIRHATFPVVVKAAEPQRLPEGVRSPYIARKPPELLAYYAQAETPDSPHLMFQEYIPQSCGEDWIFHGYCNPQTECFVAFTGKKLRSNPPFAGITSLGVSVRNEPLIAESERLLRTIGYSGIMDLDYRLDKRDCQYKLLDFNPRIGANFRMFEDHAETDVVRALYLDLTGRSVRRLPVVEDRIFIVENHDILASLRYFHRGALTIRTWWRSMRGQREIAWFDWRDPVPFFTMSVRFFCQTAARMLRRTWSRLRIDWAWTPRLR
jgi:D-aspartate ligase